MRALPLVCVVLAACATAPPEPPPRDPDPPAVRHLKSHRLGFVDWPGVDLDEAVRFLRSTGADVRLHPGVREDLGFRPHRTTFSGRQVSAFDCLQAACTQNGLRWTTTDDGEAILVSFP